MQIKLDWTQKKQGHALWPVFIPFAGCKVRCIFCAQELQSGTKLNSIKELLIKTQAQLKQRQQEGKSPPELGFFGGTFTAIDGEDLELCCDFVHQQRLTGLISHARCSTRPDAINIYILNKLQKAGFQSIELGIQSFNDDALQFTKRGYNHIIAQKACELIKQQGFHLGIQLMPGMPNTTEEIFIDDVEKSLQFKADFLRLYPCQVIKHTTLANLWAENKYKPWDLEQTISNLAKAWLMAHASQVPVIRMGLAPEEGLDDAILAGPRHASLGNLVQAKALFDYVSHALNGQTAKAIALPKSCQGFFGGHKNSLLKKWQALGISSTNTSWHNFYYIEIKT